MSNFYAVKAEFLTVTCLSGQAQRSGLSGISVSPPHLWEILKNLQKYLHISKKSCNFAAEFSCGKGSVLFAGRIIVKRMSDINREIMTKEKFFELLTEEVKSYKSYLETDSHDWIVKGFIDVNKNVYTITNDTTVVSKII